MKQGLAVFGPATVGAGRVLFGALVMAALWRMQRKAWPLRKRDIAPLLFITLVGSAIPFVVQPHIIRIVEAHSNHGSSFAGLLVSPVPLLTILVSMPMLGVFPTVRQLIGIVGGLAGMLYLFGGELDKGVEVGDLMMASLTPIGYAVATTYIKRRFADVPTTALVATTLGLAVLMLLPFATALISTGIEPIKTDGPVVGAACAVIVLGVVCTALATLLFYTMIQHEGPLFASMVSYIIPTVAMIAGALTGEQITGRQVAVLAFIFVMVAVTQIRPRPVVAAAPRDD